MNNVDGIYLTDSEYEEYLKLPSGRVRNTYIFNRKEGDDHETAYKSAQQKDVMGFITTALGGDNDVNTDPNVQKTLLEKTRDWIYGRYPGEKLFVDLLGKIDNAITQLKNIISRGVEWVEKKIDDFFDWLFS